MNWLFKEEPSSYSFDDLVKDGRTRWSGVKNPLAQKHLRAVRRGDRVLYYHTGGEKAVVGVARAASDAYDDPEDPSGRRAAVDIAPENRLPRRGRLLGLYQGQPLTRRDSGYGMAFPDKITIYQLNVEAICRNDAEIREEVRRTVLHEIAHHFGIDDSRLHDLGY